jgi:hypothetical protein
VEIERSHWSIVLLGSFNPAIFHPSWFEMHDVISRDIAAIAETKVVHNEISIIELGDITINVEAGKFQVETSVAPEIRLLDFVSKVFGDVLPHSKIGSFGINKSVHFRASSNAKRTEIGRRLAPTEPWGAFGDRLENSSGALLGGMMSIRMREILEDDDSRGHLEARVEPSNTIDKNTGIFVTINRHYELKDVAEHAGAREAIEKLDKEFESTLDSSDELINHFVEMAD